MTRTRVVWLVSLAWLACAGLARADNASLVAARQAIQDVRYDDARRLLVDALATGTNQPDALIEIYRLSAATAIVLGDRELAVQYYRRMLALDPAATLPADASPKLREPFIDAQAYMAAAGRLDAHAVRHGPAVTVTVIDPLGMVARVTAAGVAYPYEGRPLELRTELDQVAIVDDHGNELRALTVLAEPEQEPPSTPLVRRWVSWAVPAAVFGTVGVGFLVSARQSKTQLDDIIAHSSLHTFSDADDARQHYQNDTLISDVSFVVAGACTALAVVLAVTRPSTRPAIVSAIGPGRAGLAIVGAF